MRDNAPIKEDTLNLEILQKTEDLLEYLQIALKQFPKCEKHVLAADIRARVYSVMKLIIIINKKYHKKTTMRELDTEIEMLRVQVRLAKNLRYVDLKKYEVLSKKINEIGKMLGGWIKTAIS